ncbi:transcriptional regulator [Candidatus Nitrososphaera evergladensis SR1]|uniref:Transcriptional regulator n=1 Tax=Candidatus Nitrososphaera evergladensis SR1 TaxID=1459636 RepID=A0A075MUN8_9ARCH|nr:transcriptional regulator [Candidatus Nitrososphaera evergladensis SR1]
MQKNIQANLGLTFKNAVIMMQKAFDFDLRKNVGINWSQAKVIMTLAQKNGVAQKEIADGICIEAPTLVPIIDKMEREGLVERRQDMADRRNNRVYLTDRSRSLQNAIDESIARVRKVAYKGITKGDLETTMEVLETITKNASDYLESQAPVAEVQKAARQ